MSYPKKSLGQNFLSDNNIIKKIVNLTEISNRNILEIGPGKGALTDEILKRNPKSLLLIEKDSLISQDLKKKYKLNKKVKVFNQDVLNFDIEKKIREKTIIFGNLPYNISSQILVKIIKFHSWPPEYTDVVFMFQKEMADRIIGKFNTTKYGRLSIITNYRLKIFHKFNVSPNCFFPKPRVNSTVILFKPKKNISNNIKKLENLEKITNIFFSNKRKMINKSMKKIFNKDIYKGVMKNIDLKCRPSDLKPEKYYEITELFENN